jgi:hypothetical protein
MNAAASTAPGASWRWPLAFEAINACSWAAAMGTPLILWLKSQGASATVLGIAVAAIPLTQSLQIVGARMLPRFGYRRLMVQGWTMRTALIGVLAGVAMASPWLGGVLSMTLTLLLIGIYCVLRGIASCAWWPWISQLIPEDRRGRFLGRSALLTQGSLLVSNLGYAAWLAFDSEPSGYAAIFVWSCATGFIAAGALARIPDAPVAAEGGVGPVPWREMLAYRPFAVLLRFNLLVYAALGALAVLWVPVLRDLHHQNDATIAAMPVWVSLAQLAVLPLIGPLADRTGSRPLLAGALAVLVVHAGLWAALGCLALSPTWWVLAAIQTTAGIGNSVFILANQRLLMEIIPGQGRSHFFAMHSLVFAVGSGIAPVLWGVALDALGGWNWAGINAHGLLYAIAGAMLAVGCAGVWGLHEPRALSTAEFLRELLVRTPARALGRLTALWDGRG